MKHPLLAIPEAYHRGEHLGITSVCSAHPLVIEAALRLAKRQDSHVLIEATCNQVNQDGGYTGMTPTAFRRLVEGIADKVGLDRRKIVLGGDHLGPSPWKKFSADKAMAKAEALIAAYAQAGFTKLHLDTSMGCMGERVALADAETAERAARLAETAEMNKGVQPPVYVIGTEVPVPGGATSALDDLDVTAPDAVARTHDVHGSAFRSRGLDDAFARVIALVVQPGVEFDHTHVTHFDAGKAQALAATLANYPGLVFEAHSTDYQSCEGLRALVGNGFAILKVGPWLTFALREALYALDAIADVLHGYPPKGELMTAMEDVMTAAPGNWENYYKGDDNELWLQRHFSYSDRIRYYWPTPAAESAVSRLMARLAGTQVPATVVGQYLPHGTGTNAEEILLAAIELILRKYEAACTG
ncbi:MAG: D-tagatose-bisphosphate aldolase, class II, non-catalytic subunit [Boseongicola sp.]|nr:D-tagatose-bisphosphate aldolase, class II, non-catalytic subunit [Boseongicola sp.]